MLKLPKVHSLSLWSEIYWYFVPYIKRNLFCKLRLTLYFGGVCLVSNVCFPSTHFFAWQMFPGLWSSLTNFRNVSIYLQGLAWSYWISLPFNVFYLHCIIQLYFMLPNEPQQVRSWWPYFFWYTIPSDDSVIDLASWSVCPKLPVLSLSLV